MKKVYLFGAYFSLNDDGRKGYGNFLLEFTSMPSYKELKQEIKNKCDEWVDGLVIISMQFLTKEQYYALKGEEKQETQSDLLDKKIADCNLSIRVKNICKANGLNTVRDVCRLAKTDWLRFRNGVKKSFAEIDDFLKDNGLDWKMNL